MQDQQSSVIQRKQAGELATNRVLRNTYALLSMTLIFSAIMAFVSMSSTFHFSPIVTMVVYFGLIFAVSAARNSAWGILLVFALTGFMGYTLGPILNLYIHGFSNGIELVSTALGMTGVIFLGLSAYAITTRKDFSYMGGFLFAAIAVAFLASLAGFFFQLPLLQLVISGAFVLISAGYILYTTSMIVNRGETNYIMATVMLYVQLFNMFVSLLQILGAFGGRR